MLRSSVVAEMMDSLFKTVSKKKKLFLLDGEYLFGLSSIIIIYVSVGMHWFYIIYIIYQ